MSNAPLSWLAACTAFFALAASPAFAQQGPAEGGSILASEGAQCRVHGVLYGGLVKDAQGRVQLVGARQTPAFSCVLEEVAKEAGVLTYASPTGDYPRAAQLPERYASFVVVDSLLTTATNLPASLASRR